MDSIGFDLISLEPEKNIDQSARNESWQHCELCTTHKHLAREDSFLLCVFVNPIFVQLHRNLVTNNSESAKLKEKRDDF